MNSFKHTLFLSVAASVVISAQAAAAQGRDTGADASGQLEEVVVTATRQSETVNRVPLSVSAVTQRALESQGVKNIGDLARTVPGVTFTRTGGENNPNITIRGIGGNAATVGAATTGVYLDDTALQRRNANGLVTGNGSPFPQLFDLERVEILRGPQGTLYGGSSQGGTVRFITPTPSLTDYSGQARIEGALTRYGDPSYEIGLATGGPLVRDKLGLRASAYFQHRGGWVDALSRYDGHRFGEDINWGEAQSFRITALWQVTDRLRVTPAFYYSRDVEKNEATFREDTPAYTVGAATVAARTFNNSGTVNGVRFQFPSRVFPQYEIPAQTWYGPYTTDQGRYFTTTDVRSESSPRITDLVLPSLTLDYEFENMTVKSVTSWVHDVTKGWDFTGGGAVRTGILPFSVLGNRAPNYILGAPNTYGYFHYNNRRNGMSEELRFSSANPESPLQWVAGAYFSNSTIKARGVAEYNENETSILIRGVPEGWFLGNNPLPLFLEPGAPLGNVADRFIVMKETELAAFGEANYNITGRLKVTAGIRFTRTELNYTQEYGGPVAGASPRFVGSPAFATTGIIVTDPFLQTPFQRNLAGCPSAPDCPIQYTELSNSESPITPKAGLSYQRTAGQLYYVTYAKGFRAGGVNPPVPPLQCAADLAILGIARSPDQYESDTVSSYELGAKLRLFDGRAQLNTSIYHIDWNNIQFNLPLRQCGFAYIANGPKAISEGFDVQATSRLGPITLSSSVSYNSAGYAADVLGPPSPNPAQARSILAKQGDNLGSPEWVVALGLQYDFTVTSRLSGYVRGDYQYTGKYDRTTGEGTTSYNALIHDGEPTHTVNARAGALFGSLEAAIFVQNLTNSKEFLNKGNGANSLVVTGTTFRPRTIGIQLTQRY